MYEVARIVQSVGQSKVVQNSTQKQEGSKRNQSFASLPSNQK